MSGFTWLICVAAMAQVGAGGGRYTSPGTTNPFSPNTPTGGANGAANDTGLVPIDPASQTNRATQEAVAPTGRPQNPLGGSGSPLGSGGVYPPPGASRPATPSTSTNPWQTSAGGAPTSSSAPVDSAGNMKPAGMMRAMLSAPRESRLPGYPISLADVVSSATSREDQAIRIEAYWDLCSSVADYYLGLREQDEFRRLRARLPHVGPAWQQAESELAVRVGTSQLAAAAAQHRLASLIGSPGGQPLPADTPHCGDYNTRYNEIFAGRSSPEAGELANLLPQRYAELKGATQAVTRAEQWLETTVTRSDNTDGVETLRALELLALRRRAFVQIARDYNRRIARYTEISTPGQVAPDRLIGMLIKRDGAATATRGSAPAPLNRQTQAAPSLPKTFDPGWTPASGEKVGDAALDEAIQQASGEVDADEPPRGERSLLVSPIE